MSSTMKQWTVKGTGNHLDTLVQEDVPLLTEKDLGPSDVLVKMRAASINYRDLIIPQGQYPFPLDLPVAAGSDGAGEVVAVGPGATRFKKGDRVATIFNRDHQAGPIDARGAGSGLGGVFDGTLREYGIFKDWGLVLAPKNLDFGEAATLTCAGVTAWNALFGGRRGEGLRPGETVLVQGTGGVSLFALQFAKAAGATVIATTSSKDKEAMLKGLGADHVLNYKEDAEWGASAKKLSKDGAGVEYIIEVGGAGTLEQSLKAVKFEGIISIIGFLGGAGSKAPNLLHCLVNVCTARGVYVGSRAQMEEMVAAIEASDIHPVVEEKKFSLDQAKEAYQYLWDKKHVGKIVINIQ